MKKIIIIMLVLNTINVFSQQTGSFPSRDGESLYYTMFGNGEKVIILYGGPGYGCNIIFNWAEKIPTYQCIFYDQRGTGLSKNVKMDSSTINLRTAVSDIEDLRIHLKESKLTIIGYSWGAGLAMAYASRYPENVAKMILVSPIGPDMSFAPEMNYNILSRRSKQEIDSLNYWYRKEIIEQNPLKAAQMQTYYAYLPYFFDHEKGRLFLWNMILNGDFNPTMANLMWQSLNANFNYVSEGIKNYKGKCYIIRGLQDVISYKVICQIKELIPQTKVTEILGCGHFFDLECAFNFRLALNAFLKE